MAQVWQDGITNADSQPVSQSLWNRSVKVVVNVYMGHNFHAFDVANARYKVKRVITKVKG